MTRVAVALAMACLVVGATQTHASASTLVYSCWPNLCEVRADGSDRRPLTRGGGIRRDYLEPSRSLDHRRIAYTGPDGHTYVTEAGRRARLHSGLVTIHPRRRQALVLSLTQSSGSFVCRVPLPRRTPFPCAFIGHGVASWGPGSDILQTGLWSDRIEVRRFALSLEGTRYVSTVARVRPGHTAGIPVLSPDGRWLGVPEGLPPEQKEIRVSLYAASTGRWIRYLTRGHRDTDVTWAPDSREIAFERDVVHDNYRSMPVSGSIQRVGRSGGRVRRVVARGYDPFWGT